MPTVQELATIVRSKNAGPYHLTYDVFFETVEAYRAAVESGVFTVESLARHLNMREDAIVGVYHLDRVLAIKCSVKRPVPSGDLRDTDIYGAQQATPLLDIDIDIDIDI